MDEGRFMLPLCCFPWGTDRPVPLLVGPKIGVDGTVAGRAFQAKGWTPPFGGETSVSFRSARKTSIRAHSLQNLLHTAGANVRCSALPAIPGQKQGRITDGHCYRSTKPLWVLLRTALYAYWQESALKCVLAHEGMDAGAGWKSDIYKKALFQETVCLPSPCSAVAGFPWNSFLHGEPSASKYWRWRVGMENDLDFTKGIHIEGEIKLWVLPPFYFE